MQIISNTNEESVTVHEGDNAEKTPIQQTEITSSTENPVESNHPVDIKEENNVLTVKEDHHEKESVESVEPKVAEEPPTQSESLEGSLSIKKEESITVEKVERKREAHFIHCSEEKTEDPYRYIDPEVNIISHLHNRTVKNGFVVKIHSVGNGDLSLKILKCQKRIPGSAF